MVYFSEQIFFSVSPLIDLQNLARSMSNIILKVDGKQISIADVFLGFALLVDCLLAYQRPPRNHF